MKKEDISTGRIIFMLCFTFMVVHIPDLNQSRLERRCLHHPGKKGLIDVVKKVLQYNLFSVRTDAWTGYRTDLDSGAGQPGGHHLDNDCVKLNISAGQRHISREFNLNIEVKICIKKSLETLFQYVFKTNLLLLN